MVQNLCWTHKGSPTHRRRVIFEKNQSKRRFAKPAMQARLVEFGDWLDGFSRRDSIFF
jgi:hypothetical protein